MLKMFYLTWSNFHLVTASIIFVTDSHVFFPSVSGTSMSPHSKSLCTDCVLNQPLFYPRFGVFPAVAARNSFELRCSRHMDNGEKMCFTLLPHFIHQGVIAPHLVFCLATVHCGSHPCSTQQTSLQSQSMNKHAWTAERPKIVTMWPQTLLFNEQAIFTEECINNRINRRAVILRLD